MTCGQTHEHTTNCVGGSFTNLHVHTEYSTLDGVNRVKEIPGIVKAQGGTHLACTEHGTCAGHWAFYNACKKADIKPILGLEAYYAMGSRHVKAKDDLGKAYYHLILLARNNAGLHNLYKLSSYSFTEGMYYKPRIDDDLLAQYSGDILATSACLGSATSQMIMRGDYKAAARQLDHHARIFQDRFFIELQPHRNPEQAQVNEILIHLAKERNLPLVVTSDAHYTHVEDKHFHETTLKMATNYSGADDDGFSFGDIDVHLATHQEMVEACKLSNIPEEAITNTRAVANLVNSGSYYSDRRNRFPRFKSLPAGITSWQYLEGLALAGLARRVPLAPDSYRDRLAYELRVLKKLDMSDYMLMEWEFAHKATELGVLVGPGRGSVGGSLVAYCIGITQLDPIKYGLMFERFLNPGRSGTPLLF